MPRGTPVPAQPRGTNTTTARVSLRDIELDKLGLGLNEPEGNVARFNEDRLAVTCAVMYSDNPRTSHTPRLFLNKVYHNRQEDAREVLHKEREGMLSTDECPRLASTLFQGPHADTLTCMCRRYTRDAGVTSVNQCFTSLSLPLVRFQAGSKELELITSVQAAIDEFYAEENMEDSFVWECNVVGCQETRAPTKRLHLTVAPKALCINLKRWADGGGKTLQHHVHTNHRVTIATHSYYLRSIVVHLGESPTSGHYVTIAYHATADGNWWLFNDAERRPATREEINCTTRINEKIMKSYILFYELEKPPPGTKS